MPRFNPTRFPPGFFDLPADAGRDLPLDVIAAWTRSNQTEAAARELLAPACLRGIVVASDTSGLTRLTQERPLIEILSMVSRPKELVHAYGKAIGGIPLGVWAADNTLMYYPESVAPEEVVSMLLALQDRVQAECEVGIGICAHQGVFYKLGKDVYGPDADRVESIAEDFTEAREVVVTGELLRSLPASTTFRAAVREDLRGAFGEVHRLTDGPRSVAIEPSDFRYPVPFSDEFYSGLSEFHRTRRTSLVPRPAYREVAVVVVEPEREDRDLPEVATLNDLALSAAVRRLGQTLLPAMNGTEIKTANGVSIYLFDDAGHSVVFCRALRDSLQSQGVELRIGVDVGRVLVFELGPGLHDLAGSPVNVASKLAQDLGQFGAIHLTLAAARLAGIAELPPSKDVRVGGVTIQMVGI